MSATQLGALTAYTACDISDALLKLKIPHAGFLVDLDLKAAPPSTTTTTTTTTNDTKPLIGIATTILLALKSSPSPPSQLPPGSHFADLAGGSGGENTIAVFSSPPGVRCAVMGGLVAARLAKRGVVGAVVDGRIRDVGEMPSGWQVWARGVSTVGAGAETRVVDVDVSVQVCGVEVKAGDVVVCDRGSGGVVVVPRGVVGDVVGMLPGLVEADTKVAVEVEGGMGLEEAFRMHRG